MRIVDIRETTVPLGSAMANAAIDFSKMTVSAVAVITDRVVEGRAVVGYGFNSNGRYAVGGVLRERIIPRVLEAAADELLDPATGLLDPARVWDRATANEKPGGHGERAFAVGALDMAIWDAVAKAEERPLHETIAQRHGDGRASDQVFVYAAGGYYDAEKGIPGLVEEMRGYLNAGYTQVKMKVGGAAIDEDRRRIEAVLEVAGAGANLAVDANGRFDLAGAMAQGEMMVPYDLAWFEEPLDPLDYAAHAALASVYAAPIATGENLFHHQDALNLARHGGLRPACDYLQFDPTLAYGLTEYLRIYELLRPLGWSAGRHVPHGGHLFSLAIAAGLGLASSEAYPGVFQPFGGFVDGAEVVDGHVAPPDLPGIGIEGKSDLFAVLRLLGDG